MRIARRIVRHRGSPRWQEMEAEMAARAWMKTQMKAWPSSSTHLYGGASRHARHPRLLHLHAMHRVSHDCEVEWGPTLRRLQQASTRSR